jgi:hypothetical protein
MGTEHSDGTGRLTPRQRLEEVGDLLSRAVRRVVAADSSAQNPLESSQNRLDLCSTMPLTGSPG